MRLEENCEVSKLWIWASSNTSQDCCRDHEAAPVETNGCRNSRAFVTGIVAHQIVRSGDTYVKGQGSLSHTQNPAGNFKHLNNICKPYFPTWGMCTLVSDTS